jgi:hypothetical protein
MSLKIHRRNRHNRVRFSLPWLRREWPLQGRKKRKAGSGILMDGFGTVDSVALNVLKAEDIVDYTQHEGLSERVLKKFGAAVGAGVVKSVWGGAKPSLR